MGCVACQKLLTLRIENSNDEQNEATASTGEFYTVPDSVEMQCGCHFHWFVRQKNVSRVKVSETDLDYSFRQCLLDSYSMTECPNCGKTLSTITASGEQQILCNLNNEGGLQQGLDILPLLTEEIYLKAYPEERRCQAFLEFCRQGDIEAIVDLLDDEQDEDDEGPSSNEATDSKIDVLRYQDQMGSMNSGLHTAILNGRVEVAWLLLFLASNLQAQLFPSEVFEAAVRLEVTREDQSEKVDIRALKDTEGLTAAQRAQEMGAVWEEWVDSGRLSISTTT